MATIKNLKLKLKSGLLSELQSDTIFGHFAWRFKDMHGEEKLISLLQMFSENNPLFTLSDGFLEKNGVIFLPKPLKLSPEKFDHSKKKDKVVNFITQKEIKAQKYITVDQLNLFLNNDLNSFNDSLEKSKLADPPKFFNDLRISVEIDRTTFKSKDGNLFSENPKYLDQDVIINVFIKIIDEEKYSQYKCDEIIKSVFEIGFGKNKSSGYGQFEVQSLSEFNGFIEPNVSNGFISLSHYLPSNNDGITESYYDINVKYGKLGEEFSKLQNPFKPAMLLLKPGSCFITKTRKDFYGRALSKISDIQPEIIHNGIAFSINGKF